MDALDNLLQAPIKLLNDVELFSNLFNSSKASSADLPFGEFSIDADFSAGARLSVLAGFEIEGKDFWNIFSMNSSDISERAFVQILEASAKFEASAVVNAELNILDLDLLKVEDGSIAFALGLGIEEPTAKIYFNEFS
eukprot:12170494-Ditylum_brightwellii.AAC.1